MSSSLSLAEEVNSMLLGGKVIGLLHLSGRSVYEHDLTQPKVMGGYKSFQGVLHSLKKYRTEKLS